MTVTAIDRSATAGSAAPHSVTVRRGDSMSAIAAHHGVSLRALIAANPQVRDPDLIHPGESLRLPGGGGGASGGRYTVRAGDTLSAIAARTGRSVSDLALDNGLTNPNLIFPGQTLRIGGGQARATGGAQSGAAVGGSGGGTGTGRNPADVARQYLGRNASDLRSDRGDNLPMDAGVNSHVCCANFVSAVLTEAGQLPASAHTNSVAQLKATLQDRGWTAVPASQAQAGDVVIIQGGGVSHTEIVSGPGQMIGSNNRNPDRSQRVTTANLSWAVSKGAVILRAPATVRAGPTAPAAPAGPVGQPSGTRAGRIDQAMTYFQAQGWSRAQAAGIVANLDAESGMEAGVRQHGGGPGYGLAQWEGPRQAGFRAWSGHDIHGSTFAEQLAYVQHELTTTERGAGARLRATSSASDAGAVVSRYYERPADANGAASHRAQVAQSIFHR